MAAESKSEDSPAADDQAKDLSRDNKEEKKTKRREFSKRTPDDSLQSKGKRREKKAEPESFELPVMHTVQDDDTCGALALKYYRKFNLYTKIQQHNGLNESCRLKPGKEIEIPAL